MGMAEEVHAWIDRTEVEPGFALDCPAMISWKVPGARYGNLEVVYSPKLKVLTEQYAQHDPIEITGTRGVLWITRGHGRISDQPPVMLYADNEMRGFSGMPAGWDASFIAATRHHIEALRDSASPSLSGEQGRDILRFCLAAQRSAREGRAVRVAEVK